MCVLGKLPQEENYRLMHMQGLLVPRFFYSKWFCFGGLFVCLCLFVFEIGSLYYVVLAILELPL